MTALELAVVTLSLTCLSAYIVLKLIDKCLSHPSPEVLGKLQHSAQKNVGGVGDVERINVTKIIVYVIPLVFS